MNAGRIKAEFFRKKPPKRKFLKVALETENETAEEIGQKVTEGAGVSR